MKATFSPGEHWKLYIEDLREFIIFLGVIMKHVPNHSHEGRCKSVIPGNPRVHVLRVYYPSGAMEVVHKVLHPSFECSNNLRGAKRSTPSPEHQLHMLQDFTGQMVKAAAGWLCFQLQYLQLEQ